MPNRIIRDWTDSATMNKLGWQEEVLFTRLIMKADDYGNYFADTSLIKSLLFPRKDGLRNSDVERWLTNLKAADLIRIYPAKGDSFLHIVNFGQRLRQKKRTYPEPPDSILSADCQQLDDNPPIETKRNETEVETETKEKVRDNVAIKRSEILKLEKEFSFEEINWMYDKLSAYKLSKGKKYKSDYGAILTWVVNSLKEEKEKNVPQKKENKTASIIENFTKSQQNIENEYRTNGSPF